MGKVFTRYLLTCDEVVEHKNGNLDFINVFESKILSDFPTKLNFVLMLAVEYNLKYKENRELKIDIILPDKTIKGNSLIIILNEDDNTDDENELFVAINQINIPNFPIDEEGQYTFVASYNEKVIGRHSVLFNREGE